MAEAEDPFEDPQTSKSLFALKKQMLTKDMGGRFTLANLVGFSDDELDAAYSVACQQLTIGNLKEAFKLFLLLAVFRHTEGKYWRGMGIVNHRAKDFRIAEIFYSLAIQNDKDDVISRAFRAEVLLWMNRRNQARQEAERAIEDGQRLGKREHLPYVKRAQAVLSSINNDDVSGTFERRS